MAPLSSVSRCTLAAAALLLASAAPAAQSEPPARDALGDPLPDGAVARLGTRRLRHETDVLDVAYSSDGSRLWSIDLGGGVRLWDAESGALVRELDVGTPPVLGFSLPADGSRIAISREGSGATVVDPVTGAVQLDLTRDGTHAIFSPDGHWIAAWGAPYTRVDVLTADGAPHEELNEKVTEFFDVAFSPDGSQIAICGERKITVRDSVGVISVRDTATGGVVQSLELKDQLPRSVAFSPDGRLLAAGDETGRLRTFVARTGEPVASVQGFDVPVRGLCWSPDGRLLAAACLGKTPPSLGVGFDGFALRDGRSLALLNDVVGHCAGVSAIAFAPDGHRVASACCDHLVRVWDPASGARLLAPAGHETGISALAVSADGALLVSSGADGRLGLWNARSFSLERLQHAAAMPLLAVACTPDGRLAAAGALDGSVTLRWTATGEDRGGWPGDPAHAARSLAFLPDGHTLVSAEADGKARVRDVSAALDGPPTALTAAVALSRPLRELDAGGSSAFSVAVSPDGKHIATGTSRLRLFNAETGVLERDIKGTSPIASIAFSPDGTLVATGNADRTVRVYDAATGDERGKLEGHTGRVHAVAFSRDGLTLASGGEVEATVRLWDVARLAPAGELTGHAGAVNALTAVGPGLIASAGDDGVVLVWRLPARLEASHPGG